MFRLCVVALTMIVILRGRVPAQDEAHGKPGPEHEKLRALVGKWDLALVGGGKGTAEFKSILGGRFVMEEVKLPFGDQSFEWVGIYGYDKQKKRYTATWVDNFDTKMVYGEAEADPAGKTFTYKGEQVDPRTGKLGHFTWKITLDGKDTLKVEMFEGGEKPQRVLEIDGKRVN